MMASFLPSPWPVDPNHPLELIHPPTRRRRRRSRGRRRRRKRGKVKKRKGKKGTRQKETKRRSEGDGRKRREEKRKKKKRKKKKVQTTDWPTVSHGSRTRSLIDHLSLPPPAWAWIWWEEREWEREEREKKGKKKKKKRVRVRVRASAEDVTIVRPLFPPPRLAIGRVKFTVGRSLVDEGVSEGSPKNSQDLSMSGLREGSIFLWESTKSE
jgi:hypothetical protein